MPECEGRQGGRVCAPKAHREGRAGVQVFSGSQFNRNTDDAMEGQEAGEETRRQNEVPARRS